jgi:hypothetical protein
MKAPDWQGQAEREARRIVREAAKHGGTVPYSLARVLELGFSLRVVRQVYRGKQ